MNDIKEILKKIPDSPGVYIMKDSKGDIIYVGKANSLKKRVRSYFNSNNSKTPKVKLMVAIIRDIEYIMVSNEVEALVLEANLIKEHKPKYNILLKDDKQYPYIKVTLKERFPRVLKTRMILKDGSRYFGPYPSAYAVNEAIEVFHSIFPIRDCRLDLNNKEARFRPCLNYHIGRCLGPCLGNVDEEHYMIYIEKVIQFLNHKDNVLVEELTQSMRLAAEEKNYELAASLRDKINSLNSLHEIQRVETTSDVEEDVIGIARGVEELVVQVFFVRGGKLVGREHFIIEDKYIEDRKAVISSFIKQFYTGVSFIPKKILVEEEPEEEELLESWLSQLKGSKVSIDTPKRGDKKALVAMVKKNAFDMLEKFGDKFLKKHRVNLQALEELKSIMGIEEDINRIEAFDISNISGVGAVASMVVFDKGEPKKSDYRRFKINTVKAPDDYRSMEEVLTRRFTRGKNERQADESSKSFGFSSFPDLIMLDGGKGQVNKGIEVLRKLGIDIPICGLVKDKYHKTRGIIFNNQELTPNKDSQAFKLIYKVQEEAHRFAISYHRSLRTKDMFKSELDGIPHIGEKRKLALLAHFKSIRAISEASVEDLIKVETINKKAAQSIHEYFNKKED